MSTEFIVESLARTVSASIEQGPKLSEATRTRLVWHVAIAGFALLNIKTLVSTFATQEPSPGLLSLAAIPWLIVVVTSLIAHYLTDKADIAREKFQVNKLSLLDLHINKIRTSGPDSQEFSALLHDTAPQLLPLKGSADTIAKWVNRLELISLIAILMGLASAVAIPWTSFPSPSA